MLIFQNRLYFVVSEGAAPNVEAHSRKKRRPRCRNVTLGRCVEALGGHQSSVHLVRVQRGWQWALLLIGPTLLLIVETPALLLHHTKTNESTAASYQCVGPPWQTQSADRETC